MNKVFKYFMNFNMVVFLAVLLALPFVPYAKLQEGGEFSGASLGPFDGGNVLSASDTKFSQVYGLYVYNADEASTSGSVMTVRNSTKSVLSYKAEYESTDEVSESQGLKVYFTKSSQNEISLNPGESDGLNVESLEDVAGKYLIFVLTSK